MNNSKLKNILATVFISLISTVELFAKNGNNPPMPRGSGGFDDGSVVGGPIDNYIPILFFVALLLGAWTLNRFNSTKKASI